MIIIVAGLFIGYRLVSHMLSPGTGDDPSPRQPSDPRKAADDEGKRSRPWTWHDTSALPQGAPTRSWYQTLGVSETASRAAIDDAYRQQISQYHPDKVATMGEEIRRVAEVRTKEINAAYDLAARLRR